MQKDVKVFILIEVSSNVEKQSLYEYECERHYDVLKEYDYINHLLYIELVIMCLRINKLVKMINFFPNLLLFIE